MRTLLLLAVSACVAAGQSAPPMPQAGNVALPLDEYNRLIERGRNPAKKPDAPPVAFAMQRAVLRMQVAGENVSGTIQLRGEVLAAGPVRVPLVRDMTVFDARRLGSALPLMLEGVWHTAVLDGPDFEIALETGLPVIVEPGRASVTIPVPAAGVARLELAIPGDHTNVSLTGGLITSRASSGGRTTIEATLTGGQTAVVSWVTREAATPAIQKEARFLADVKSLVTVAESEMAMAALAEVTVIQGEPVEFEVAVPAGWEVTSATGGTLQSSEMRDGVLMLKTAAARTHAFLIQMERAVSGAKAEVMPLSFAGAQRETGEIVAEGEGAMEFAFTEQGGVKRMDLKEASPYLLGMARHSGQAAAQQAAAQAAFRYHRQPGETPGIALAWTRFPDATRLAAVAQQATITTLVTSEGRSLTEIRLLVRNREQPFLKVTLPAGASIVSAEVEGVGVKLASAGDGSRVPLLRAGFRPPDLYTVSFVMLHSGTPFARKGGSELALPKMDIPIALVEWEVFLPQRYRVTDFGGDAVAAALLRYSGSVDASVPRPINLPAGQIGGYVVDPLGFAVPGAQVTVTHAATGFVLHATAGPDGQWVIPGMPPGRIRVSASAPGFVSVTSQVDHAAERPSPVNIQLPVGGVAETVTVTALSEPLNTSMSSMSSRSLDKLPQLAQKQASVNVSNLQRRVAGVLPIPVDVPRTGNSYRFVRPLVVDEETTLTFSYKAGR